MAKFWKHTDGSTGAIVALPVDPVTGQPVDEALHVPAGVMLITEAEYKAATESIAQPVTTQPVVEQPTTTTTTGNTTVGALSDVAFTKLNGATTKPGSITKTGGTATGWDASAWSEVQAVTDGVLSWYANVDNAAFMLGWSAPANLGSVNWKGMAHVLYFAPNATGTPELRVYEMGVEKYRGAYAKGNTALISLVGATVIYSVDSKLIYTSQRAQGALVAGAIIRSQGIEIANIKQFVK